MSVSRIIQLWSGLFLNAYAQFAIHFFPFFARVENEVRSQKPNVKDIDSLVNSSGKLVLLDKLLPRLKADGHRILLFSQFKIMLDIIEDYLHLRDFKCERIDGSITGMKRQAAIDRFQSKDNSGREQPFIMLLSTRAGGVGINLTAADTCVSLIEYITFL